MSLEIPGNGVQLMDASLIHSQIKKIEKLWGKKKLPHPLKKKWSPNIKSQKINTNNSTVIFERRWL